MSFSHDTRDFCLAAAANVRSSWADTPAALHDCSIKLSYVSDTSSAVQPATRFIHWAVAHAYRSPASVGAFFNSLSGILYLADAPADTARIALFGGVPALDVPQYWHRAAGFDDMFIAHAESRQRVKLAREHDAVAAYDDPSPSMNSALPQANLLIKCIFFCFIFSLYGKLYQKIIWAQSEKNESVPDKADEEFFV